MNTWLPFPIQTSRVRIAVLRLLFRKRWYVRIRGHIYILRDPVEDSE